MIKKFEEFVNEGLWKSGIDRSVRDDVRKEDGISVKLPDGQKVVLTDMDCGTPYKLGGDVYFREVNLEKYTRYIFGYEDGGQYSYFVFEPGDDEPLLKIATSDYDMTTDDFILIRAMYSEFFQDINGEEMTFTSSQNSFLCEASRYQEYIIYDDRDNAIEDAIRQVRDLIDESYTDGKWFEKLCDKFRDNIVDMDSIREVMEEYFETYVDDIEDETGTMGYRLYDELESRGIIEDTDEYFESDENGDLDYESPKFNVDDCKSQYVKHMVNDVDDPFDWYVSNFGTDGINSYIDLDKLAECIIESDGPEYELASYDGREYNFCEDGYDIYIYRRN